MEQSTTTAFDDVSRTVGEAACFESDPEPPEQPTRRAAHPSRRNLDPSAILACKYTASKDFVPTLRPV
jgi:hypothetical protein